MGTYFQRVEPPFYVCVCATFWASFLPRHVSGKVIGGGEIWMNSRSPSTFPPPTRGGAIAQSPSAYINPSTLQGEDIPTLVSLPLFPSLGERQNKNTIHPFPPFPDLARFHRKTAPSDLAQSIISIRSISWHLPISCFQPKKIN